MSIQRELEQLTEKMYREGYYYGWIKAMHAISSGFSKDEIEKHARGTLRKWKEGVITPLEDVPEIRRHKENNPCD